MKKYVLVSLETGKVVARFTEEKINKIQDLYGLDDYYMQIESEYYKDLAGITDKQVLTSNNESL